MVKGKEKRGGRSTGQVGVEQGETVMESADRSNTWANSETGVADEPM
jgi:hypothetical protein